MFSWVSPWQCLPERDAESTTPLSLSSSSLSLLFSLLFLLTVSEGPSQGTPPKRDRVIIFHQKWLILYVTTSPATRCQYNSIKCGCHVQENMSQVFSGLKNYHSYDSIQRRIKVSYGTHCVYHNAKRRDGSLPKVPRFWIQLEWGMERRSKINPIHLILDITHVTYIFLPIWGSLSSHVFWPGTVFDFLGRKHNNWFS